MILYNKAAKTFCQAIMEVGVDRVYSLKIPTENMYLVTIGRNYLSPSSQYDVGNGYFVNVHSNTVTKKRHLERIFKVFNISLRVEIINP